MSDYKPAPEIIFLQWSGREHDEDNTWCSDLIHDDDIVYIKKTSSDDQIATLKSVIENAERFLEHAPELFPLNLRWDAEELQQQIKELGNDI